MMRTPADATPCPVERPGVVRGTFEERCPAVRPVTDAFATRLVTGFGWEDERARDLEAFVTDEP
jgi:hypothetical protein